jgi:hypothetical protein
LFSKLIKAIDASVLKKDPIVNFHPDKSAFQKLENLNVCACVVLLLGVRFRVWGKTQWMSVVKAVLEAAPRLGCQIVNVGGSDLAAGTVR